jgi:hypothetical protein
LRTLGQLKPKGACGLWPGDGQEPSGRQRSTCACESRGGACERGGSADTCVSRISPFKSLRAASSARTSWRIAFCFPMVRKAAAPGQLPQWKARFSGSWALIVGASGQVNAGSP